MNKQLPDLKFLTDTLAVHPQLRPEDMEKVANAGFKSIVINLPDYELDQEQPTAEEIMAAAQLAGLIAIYQPVSTPLINTNDCENFHKNIKSLPTPILAFCRTGNRCSLLFNGLNG